MRLDKFLQLSRLVRRRTLAHSLCRAGRVTLNGRRAAPAALVRLGDVVMVELTSRRFRARVLTLPEGASRREGAECCEILEDTALE
jgi:ribosomal 50S subunit-recycling heat shock protein